MRAGGKLIFGALAALSLLAGCTSNALTSLEVVNLTPAEQVRNASGQYLVEALWKSNQQSLRRESLQGFVKVGTSFYPMRRVDHLPNRWEALIPVGPDQESEIYSFKFVYLYNAIPVPREDSLLSRDHKLTIVAP